MLNKQYILPLCRHCKAREIENTLSTDTRPVSTTISPPNSGVLSTTLYSVKNYYSGGSMVKALDY